MTHSPLQSTEAAIFHSFMDRWPIAPAATFSPFMAKTVAKTVAKTTAKTTAVNKPCKVKTIFVSWGERKTSVDEHASSRH